MIALEPVLGVVGQHCWSFSGQDTLIKIGPLPVKIGFEAYCYLERDSDFGPEWQFRLLFVPVLPAPAWSRNPLA